MNMKYEWYFSEKQFKEAQDSTIEDNIYGWVCAEAADGREKYLIDIHKEYYDSKENGYDLEVYTESPEGGHGTWLGCIHEIKSAVSLKRFMSRAEKVLDKFLAEALTIDRGAEYLSY